MPAYAIQPQALDGASLEAMRTRLLGSPLVATSPLAGSFRKSRGFAVTFTADARSEVERRLPGLVPFLSVALRPGPVREVSPPLARLRRRVAAPNAFYVNLLLLEDGEGISPHVDGTLRGPSGVPDAVPLAVSVLYLCVPRCLAGGELILTRGRRRVGAIQPKPGALVHFRGDLEHQVRPLEGVAPGERRASVVCEQYHFPPHALSRLAGVRVHSRAGFEGYLHDRIIARQGAVGLPTPSAAHRARACSTTPFTPPGKKS